MNPMKALSVDFRHKIIETYENEPVSQRQLAKRFRISLSSVTRILKQYRQTGDLNPKPRPGRSPTLNSEHLQLLEDLVNAQSDITLGELCQALFEQTEISVSEPTMCRVMQRLNLTRKKKALHPPDKESERVQRLRCQYWEHLRDVRAEDLIFIDESGVNLGLIRLFAWAIKGKRAYAKKPKRGKHVSIAAALSLTGVVAFAVIFGAFDGLTFEAFIQTRLVPKLWPGACVVMDNCSIHKEEEIRPMIEAVGARLVYLPPYSPDFSPIENFWSKVKAILKTIGARSYQALSEAIDTAFGKTTQTDIKNWFTHCCYCSQ